MNKNIQVKKQLNQTILNEFEKIEKDFSLIENIFDTLEVFGFDWEDEIKIPSTVLKNIRFELEKFLQENSDGKNLDNKIFEKHLELSKKLVELEKRINKFLEKK